MLVLLAAALLLCLCAADYVTVYPTAVPRFQGTTVRLNLHAPDGTQRMYATDMDVKIPELGVTLACRYHYPGQYLLDLPATDEPLLTLLPIVDGVPIAHDTLEHPSNIDYAKAAHVSTHALSLSEIIPRPLEGGAASAGTAVAMDGDMLYVAAPLEVTDSFHGQVAVYKALEGTYQFVEFLRTEVEREDAKFVEFLRTEVEREDAKFGAALAAGDNWLFVGAPGEHAVYCYFDGELVDVMDGVAGYGSSLAYEDGTLAVGSPEHVETTNSIGSVDVYHTEDDYTMEHLAKIAPPQLCVDNEDCHHFGRSVAVEGTRVLVGNMADTVFVFKADSSYTEPSYSHTASLQHTEAYDGDFSASLSACDGLAAVSVTPADEGYGGFYLYAREGDGTYSLLSAEGGDEHTHLGGSVAVGGEQGSHVVGVSAPFVSKLSGHEMSMTSLYEVDMHENEIKAVSTGVYRGETRQFGVHAGSLSVDSSLLAVATGATGLDGTAGGAYVQSSVAGQTPVAIVPDSIDPREYDSATGLALVQYRLTTPSHVPEFTQTDMETHTMSASLLTEDVYATDIEYDEEANRYISVVNVGHDLDIGTALDIEAQMEGIHINDFYLGEAVTSAARVVMAGAPARARLSGPPSVSPNTQIELDIQLEDADGLLNASHLYEVHATLFRYGTSYTEATCDAETRACKVTLDVPGEISIHPALEVSIYVDGILTPNLGFRITPEVSESEGMSALMLLFIVGGGLLLALGLSVALVWAAKRKNYRLQTNDETVMPLPPQ
ncbi:hypothetical protein KIPB_003172 [Kipferlia bialata]|uniref:Uncharacterized protein n=1 Tax=Kipferlia bialata TaxID=797122 RepID=A0A9K3CU14_9EUKA|nr:hypothetical protein KIPB_003172 [Kipferlia bialata]|eukprot:g3172.t1